MPVTRRAAIAAFKFRQHVADSAGVLSMKGPQMSHAMTWTVLPEPALRPARQ
jgi:hypothetical protein